MDWNSLLPMDCISMSIMFMWFCPCIEKTARYLILENNIRHRWYWNRFKVVCQLGSYIFFDKGASIFHARLQWVERCLLQVIVAWSQMLGFINCSPIIFNTHWKFWISTIQYLSIATEKCHVTDLYQDISKNMTIFQSLVLMVALPTGPLLGPQVKWNALAERLRGWGLSSLLWRS